MDHKERWLRWYEEKLNELEDRGIKGPKAEELATAHAEYKVQEDIANRIDWARMRKKEGDL